MANALDIPESCRNTVQIGGHDYHYERSTRSGQLMLVPGPDTRDWFAIDRGALDYSAVARQEHDLPGFAGHDGPKIAAACPLCAGTASDGAHPTRDPDAALRSLAAQGNAQAQAVLAARGQTAGPQPQTEYVIPTLTPEQQELVDARLAAKAAEAAAAQLQAQLDHQQEKNLTPPGGVDQRVLVAEPAPTPGPTDGTAYVGQHVGAGTLSPEAADDATRAARIAALEAEADAAKAAEQAAFDQEIASLPQPADNLDHPAEGPSNEAKNVEANGGEQPEMGVDPFSGQPVRIFWKIPGASPTHPYGAKADGTPRKPVGRKAAP